jgi:hypothetical protein
MKLRHIFVSSLLVATSLSGMCQSIRDCEKKTNKDEQYLCTATSMVNAVVCDQISSSDGASYCRAMVASNSYSCDKIVSPIKRQSCLMAVRDKQRVAMWR